LVTQSIVLEICNKITRSRHALVYSLQHGRQDVMVLRFALYFAESASNNASTSAVADSKGLKAEVWQASAKQVHQSDQVRAV
jgi:hypothetical protein